MGNVDIREIRSEELPEYRQFLNTGLEANEAQFRITVQDDHSAPFPTKDRADSFTLGAYIDNELAGIVSFTRDGNDRKKLRHKGILFRMYVAEAHRGQGIAAQLIDALINRAKDLTDIEQINLTVVAGNTNARALYERKGFILFGKEKNAIKWNGQYFDEDQMVLSLK
jgi:RimJ/RimL family protein N-acetyltransferase